MTLNESYAIQPVDKRTAQTMIIDFHYLHRKAPCSYAFGMYEKVSGELVGVVLYGKPASHWLCKGIAGDEEAKNVIELTRLWIKDGTPKNSESWFVGNTLKLVDYDIIVSFADKSANHVGTIYQATNFLYTGLSDRHVEWTIEGHESTHCRHLFDKYGGVKKAKEILGDKMIRGERPRKHRYIYLNCDKRRKKEILNKMKYKVQDYPKLVGERKYYVVKKEELQPTLF